MKVWVTCRSDFKSIILESPSDRIPIISALSFSPWLSRSYDHRSLGRESSFFSIIIYIIITMYFSPLLLPSPNNVNLPSTIDVCSWQITYSFSITSALAKALVYWFMWLVFPLASLFAQPIHWTATHITFWNTDVAMSSPMTYKMKFKCLLLEFRTLPGRTLGCHSHYSPLGILLTLTSHCINWLFLNELWSSRPPGLHLTSL